MAPRQELDAEISAMSTLRMIGETLIVIVFLGVLYAGSWIMQLALEGPR